MTLTKEFALRSRQRVAQARAMILKLRDTSKETFAQLKKLDKQYAADRARLGDQLGILADGVIGKLPEDATEADDQRALALEAQIADLQSAVEETSFGGFFEDLERGIREMLNDDGLKSLKATDEQIAHLEKLGAKLGI